MRTFIRLFLVVFISMIFCIPAKSQIGNLKNIKDRAGAIKSATNKANPGRELKDNEKGNFIFSTSEFTVGSGALSATLELPNPFKWYVMKWCKSSSCDYDQGDLNFAAFIDDELLTAWSAKIWDSDYKEAKSFPIVVLPETDIELGTYGASFNKSKLFKDENPLVYAMYDFIYSGRLKPGTHNLKIKVYTDEVVPLNEAYENIAEYHNKWTPIAENSITLTLTEAGLKGFIDASNAKKLTHAGGDWDAIDNHLKSTAASGLEKIQIIDVATNTEWKVTLNAFGVPIFRECKADIIYNSSEYGCRKISLVKIKQDYNASTGYGNPYVAENLNSYFFVGSTMVNHIHVPIPLSKVE
jgi:hypothetical protein